MSKFEIADIADDEITISGPLSLIVEDRCTDEIIESAERMIKILNDHWNDKKYSKHSKDIALLELEKWFVHEFQEISVNVSNSESIYEIEVSKEEDHILIYFGVDGYEYGIHRNNTIEIYKDNRIEIYPSEFLESREIVSYLIDSITEKLKTWKV